MAEEQKNPTIKVKERGPRADMMEFVGRLFSDDSIEPKEKMELLNIIKKSIDTIESTENKNGS